ncbi:MAG: tetratricopeptide repeat protein [Alphaproteobacteria bacterium]|nr:tetratricopeptide repeat protein [Alphaproteobacteria bacterium]
MTRPPLCLLLLSLALAACATSASPEDAQMSNNLSSQGKTLLAAGKNAEARDIYASATARDDQNARAWNGLGVAYDLLGKKNKARDAFQHAVDLAPNDPIALNNLAHSYMEAKDPAAAVRLLTPYANAPDAPAALKQNLAAASKAAEAKEAAGGDVYADLGSYPTEGMAQGHVAEAKSLLGDDAENVTFLVIPEVKVSGGTPVFTIKAVGKPPQALCEDLNAKAFPCVPYGK